MMKHIHQKNTESPCYTYVVTDLPNIEDHPSLLDHPELFEIVDGPPPEGSIQLVYQSSIGEE